MSPTPQASLRRTVSLNFALMGKCGVYTCHRIHTIYHNVTNTSDQPKTYSFIKL